MKLEKILDIVNSLEKNSFLKIIDNKTHASHAVTEVQTARGWVIVDSNIRFISIDEDDKPFSICEIQKYALRGKEIVWSDLYKNNFNDMFKNNFIFVYGLYSRHGDFYPPYNPVPDINWKEFLQNFTD